MTSPAIELSGNLGERHRSFNSMVQDAFLQNTPLLSQAQPNDPTLNRLFEIDLASKQKNTDYIIQSLKDDDMLYVSRALKSLWILDPEYVQIINPSFLEQELFPQMLLPAVNKMRHRIQMHLRDPERCEGFYQFYKEKDFDTAAQFLWHCSSDCILGEINGILEKITPKLLKRLSEKVPQVSKIYYDNLKDNNNILKYYLENEPKFFKNVKYLLKSDPDVFFYILENFASQRYSSLNASLTKYIMKHHKTRFVCKPELYTTWFLDIKTLAGCLNTVEIKDLVLNLVRAEYLTTWFSYQMVEPFIKRLGHERIAFKKLVFVDKDIGITVKEWPYPIPTPPKLVIPQTNLFKDTKTCITACYGMGNVGNAMEFRSMLKKRKYAKSGSSKTLLDQLFDKYRFCNYKQTLQELQKRLKAESSPQNRQFMLLVLVSKTGGQPEDLVSFLELLTQFKNEPVHMRATIFRSLVKRAFSWRLPAEHWAKLLEWGHGLGLDGSSPEAACDEGLHAVVIRDLLADVKPSAMVWKKYLTDFNTLKDFSFTIQERQFVSSRLAALLLSDAQSESYKPNFTQLQYLLDTLEAYRIRFEDLPGTLEAIASAIKKYWNADDETLRNNVESILWKLYNARVARKLLIKETFELMQTDASYVNALRHDITILENATKLEILIDGKKLKHENFFRKLAMYFMEKDGLGERYRTAIVQRATTAPGEAIATRNRYHRHPKGENSYIPGRQTLAMPLALLSGSNFPSLLNIFDTAPPKTAKRQMAAALKANAHLVRPAFDLESFGWRKMGAKAVANRVSICRQRDVERHLKETLSWRQTIRLALMLAKRANKERDAFEVLASKRPVAALQAALKYFRRKGENSDPRIWEMVKSNISKANSRHLRTYVDTTNIKLIPTMIRAEYCFLVYLACKQNEPNLALPAFSQIPAILPKLDQRYIYDANQAFMSDYFTENDTIDYNDMFYKTQYVGLYIEIVAKFLVLSTSEEMLNERIKRIGLPFLKQLEILTKKKPKNKYEPMDRYLDSFLFYLRYNQVYFDGKHVSCLPLFEKVTEWMQSFLPIEIWFDKYVTVHLTMIYFKSVKHCIKQNPELFLEESRKLEGSEMLGTIFAKFLSNEIEELIQKYFTSVTEVYASCFISYYSNYFCQLFDESVEKFTVAILNGLINKSTASCVLAKYIFCENWRLLNKNYVNDIVSKFKESDIAELRVFELDI